MSERGASADTLPRLAAAATAFPEHRYEQAELRDALKVLWNGSGERAEAIDRVYARVGVNHRHLALERDAYRTPGGFKARNDVWIDAAQRLGADALRVALERAGVAPDELRAIFFVSITGLASPSIDARLVNRMGLSQYITRVPIFGLGCAGGAAGIGLAADHVRAYPDHVAAVVAVELCSLTFQIDDRSPVNTIASGLFADGAAAAVVTGARRATRGPEVLASRAVLYRDTEHVMGWDVGDSGFRLVLSREVPELVHTHFAKDVDALLADHGLRRDDVDTWILHPGGPAVLRAYADALTLAPGALDDSWGCLREVGNLSSASVLAVLERVLARPRPAPGRFGVLAALGPGFGANLVLLRW